MDLRSFTRALWELVAHARPGDGRGLENAVRELLVAHRLRSDHVPGGYALLGIGSASGLWHQLDVEAHLSDAILVVELKAYAGALPKKDLLHFVAATDDLWLGRSQTRAHLPVYRAVAVAGRVPERLRTYAGLHGVLLMDPWTVPVPILGSPRHDPSPGFVPVSEHERAAINRLVFPMRHRDGRLLPRASELRFGIRSQLTWSDRMLRQQTIGGAA